MSRCDEHYCTRYPGYDYATLIDLIHEIKAAPDDTGPLFGYLRDLVLASPYIPDKSSPALDFSNLNDATVDDRITNFRYKIECDIREQAFAANILDVLNVAYQDNAIVTYAIFGINHLPGILKILNAQAATLPIDLDVITCDSVKEVPMAIIERTTATLPALAFGNVKLVAPEVAPGVAP